MYIIIQQLKPFASLLSIEPMPKSEFLKISHRYAMSTESKLVNLLEMIQFTRAYKIGEDVELD